MIAIPFNAPLVDTSYAWLQSPTQAAQAGKAQSIALSLIAGDILKGESFGQGTNWLLPPPGGAWVRFSPMACMRMGIALFPPGIPAPDIAVNIAGFPANIGGMWHGTYAGRDIIISADYYCPLSVLGSPYTVPASGQYTLASYWWAGTDDSSGGTGNALCVAGFSQRLHGMIFRNE